MKIWLAGSAEHFLCRGSHVPYLKTIGDCGLYIRILQLNSENANNVILLMGALSMAAKHYCLPEAWVASLDT
jgi:hypothetical protein